ncbi:MAG: alkaline phosphatase [Bacteroidia bacterium]|nr:alkaline phosphatase [Bacteroidia bacterium]
MNKIAAVLLVFFLFGSCRSSKVDFENGTSRSSKKPINVIFVIGDGMGLTQVTAGMLNNFNKIELEKCTTIGLIKTHAADDLITDSAAGATAFATGKKTYLGAIGVNSDTLSVKNIFDKAKKKDMGTGVVVTSEITHATPAAFFAHEDYRLNYENIAQDFLSSDMDIAIGGGLKYFRDRRDKKNLLPKLEKKGYLIRNWQTEFHKLQVPQDQKLIYFTALDQPKRRSKGRVYLPKATEFAMNFLQERSKSGFMLMVEGSQIDWGGHANNGQYVIDEMLDFNETLKKIFDFAEKDGHTLVVVTADHETGGLAIKRGSELHNLNLKFSSGGHTGTMIPVFAYGPGAEYFGGIYDNTEIFNKIQQALGWKKNKDQ